MAVPVPVLSRMDVLLSFPPNTLLAESPAVEAISMKSAIAGGLLVAEIVCSLSLCVAANCKIRKTANRIQPTRTHSDPMRWLRTRRRRFSCIAGLVFISRIDGHLESDLGQVGFLVQRMWDNLRHRSAPTFSIRGMKKL